ncbi:CHAT domain-containing protein [Microbispora corallina]|uniref:CHAT domain-containing protein n=1 Tax=Microbispora corallina TaxID=83302 RepID=A0ABQ4FT96_9ACTN|nr:CHAT domain-containing protein [Microbispora corallina]GIH38044.1 CHAT domain-containing protein [Microbispora corallina]
MSAPDPPPAAVLVARAESAVRLSGSDPRLALSEARDVLAEAAAVRDGQEAVSVALRASALAARELGDLELAAERLEEAVAAGAAFPPRVAQARMSLVTVRAQLGDPEGGLALADLAERDLSGTDLARLDVQRSAALILLGRHRDAVRHCDRAVGLLEEDPRFLAGGLLNRGVARTYLQEYGTAEEDLSRCAATARAAGLDHVAMLAEGNLPFVAARRGDIAAAFERYQAAESALFGYPERLAAMRTDFAEALVAARLPVEARTLLEQAVPDLVAGGAHAAVPGARLLLAQAGLLAGDARLARSSAETALDELAEQGRHAWIPLAAEVILRARLQQEPPDDGTLHELLACADDLAAHGWPAESAALRLTAAAAAVRLGRPGLARAHLLRLASSSGLSPGSGPDAGDVPFGSSAEVTPAGPAAAIAGDVAQASGAGAPTPGVRPVVRQHARALLHRLDGDREAALAAAGAGIRAAAAGLDAESPDVRAHAARPAEDLAAFGLDLALESGDPWTVLTWAERWRSVVRGTPPPPLAGPAALGGTFGTLVELVRRGDDLWAVTAGRRECALRSLGSYAAAVEATVRVRYGLRRRCLRDAGDEDGLARELPALDLMLLEPLDLDDGPVTIVPTGALCTLPWPLLPSLAGRPVSVAADAVPWLRPGAGPGTGSRPTSWGSAANESPPWPATETSGPQVGPARSPAAVVALAGPGLRHAAAEADAVAAAHPGGRRVGATRQEVMAALEHADALHVAAHGMFSPRSPMLSRITLDDGPLMGYDLLRAEAVPRLVVLSACDAGMAHAPVDGAALGLAGAFLDRGSSCVVAGVVPVRDDEAFALMTLFHGLLADGRAAAEALGVAAGKTGAAGFVCFGDGALRLRPAAR